MSSRCWAVVSLLILALAARANPADLTTWVVSPTKAPGVRVTAASAELTGGPWTFLRSPARYGDVSLDATFTIKKAASQFRFFGESWSVWPDPTFADQGFEAGLLLRGGE